MLYYLKYIMDDNSLHTRRNIVKRRKFIQLSAVTAMSIQSSIALSGCGSSTKESANIQGITADDKVRSILNIQKTNDALHTKVSQNTVGLLDSTTTSELFAKFQDNSLSLKPNFTDLYFPQNELWSNYKDSHSLAYKQVNSQLTKLKATLRVYGYKQATAKQNGTQKVALSATPSHGPALDSAMNTFLQAIEDFKNMQFGAVALDGALLRLLSACTLIIAIAILEILKATSLSEEKSRLLSAFFSTDSKRFCNAFKTILRR